GIFGMRFPLFVLLAGAGALLYAGVFVGLGWIFSSQLEAMASGALRLGEWLVLIVAAGAGAYVLAKYRPRRRFMGLPPAAPTTPDELKRRLDRKEDVVVVDLRHPLAVESDPYHIPGALVVSPDDLERRHPEIPRDRDIVLYCT